MSAIWIQFLTLGLVAGIAGGMFGIGGGAIIVPVMVLLMGLDQKLATGTSVAAQILPIGLLAAIVYYRNGNLNIKYAAFIAVGLLVGNLFGALFANQTYISSEMMKKLYGIFLVLIGIRYLVNFDAFNLPDLSQGSTLPIEPEKLMDDITKNI